jgi:hypothetical protein
VNTSSALASVLLLMSRSPERWLDWLIALLLAWFGSGLIIFLSSGLRRFLGERAGKTKEAENYVLMFYDEMNRLGFEKEKEEIVLEHASKYKTLEARSRGGKKK